MCAWDTAWTSHPKKGGLGLQHGLRGGAKAGGVTNSWLEGLGARDLCKWPVLVCFTVILLPTVGSWQRHVGFRKGGLFQLGQLGKLKINWIHSTILFGKVGDGSLKPWLHDFFLISEIVREFACRYFWNFTYRKPFTCSSQCSQCLKSPRSGLKTMKLFPKNGEPQNHLDSIIT